MYKATENRESVPPTVKQLSIFRALGIAMMLSLGIHASVQAALVVEALDNIEASVLNFVKQQYAADEDVDVSVGRLDQRLRLSRCTTALAAAWAPGSAAAGRTTVSIRCNGERPWKLYVPVRVALQQNVAVTTRPMIRGERIGPGDLVLEKRPVGRQQDMVIHNLALVRGYFVNNTLPAGKVVQVRMLSAPLLVRRGHQVILSALSSGLNINMKGIALNNGRLGQTVKVQNPVSKRILEGIVTAAGQVRTHVQ